jgi:hypothetical protein
MKLGEQALNDVHMVANLGHTLAERSELALDLLGEHPFFPDSGRRRNDRGHCAKEGEGSEDPSGIQPTLHVHHGIPYSPPGTCKFTLACAITISCCCCSARAAPAASPSWPAGVDRRIESATQVFPGLAGRQRPR